MPCRAVPWISFLLLNATRGVFSQCSTSFWTKERKHKIEKFPTIPSKYRAETSPNKKKMSPIAKCFHRTHRQKGNPRASAQRPDRITGPCAHVCLLQRQQVVFPLSWKEVKYAFSDHCLPYSGFAQARSAFRTVLHNHRIAKWCVRRFYVSGTEFRLKDWLGESFFASNQPCFKRKWRISENCLDNSQHEHFKEVLEVKAKMSKIKNSKRESTF